MIKVLLDTDIGTDVDDAVCLAYLLARPECELLGITTVTGEATRRASLASVLCKVAGRDIPIYPGCEAPMEGQQRQTIAQQAVALSHWPHKIEFPQGQAIDFLQRTIRAHPGEVILLCVGSLTNIGRLFSEHPDIPPLLKGLVLMGGIFTRACQEKYQTEWNIGSDPLAAEIVYRAPVGLHRSVGLDVTQQVNMQAEEVRRSFRAPLLQPVLDFAEIWFKQFYPHITFHDPLAAATLFDETLCEYQNGIVSIDRAGRPGLAHFSPRKQQPHHQVAISINVDRYFEHFFSTFR